MNLRRIWIFLVVLVLVAPATPSPAEVAVPSQGEPAAAPAGEAAEDESPEGQGEAEIPYDASFGEAIEVSGRPVSTVPSYGQVVERLQLEPGGVAAIDATEVRAGRTATVTDALASAAGVIAQSRFGAEEARLSIRGSGLQRTFHGRGLQLLQDGIPLNLADGSFDFQAVEPLAMTYATVLRGPNAFAKGGTTLGGAIDFVSPTGYDTEPLVRVEAGSFDYLRGQAALSGHGSVYDGFLTIAHFGQEGFRDHAEQSTQRLFSNIGKRHSGSAESRLYLTAVQTDSQLPGSLTLGELRDDPTQTTRRQIDLGMKRDFDLVRLSELTVLTVGGGTLELGAFYAYKDLSHPIFQVLEQESHDVGSSMRFTSRRQLWGADHEVTVGFIPTIGWLRDERFVNAGGSPGAPTAQGDTTSWNANLYVEDRVRASERLSVVGGIAFSQAERDFEDQFLSDGDQSDDRSFDALLPRLGILYQVSPQLALFGNVARSFEPPSFGELSNRGGDGLAPVDEQTSTSFELGGRGNVGQGQFDVVLYHAEVEGELLSLTDALGDPLGTVNADRTTHSGVEAALSGWWRAEQDLAVRSFLTYTYSRLRFDDDPVFGDNELAGLPEHLVRAGFEARFAGRWFAGPVVRWAPGDYYVDHANTLRAPGYTLLDLRIGYRGDTRWQFFVEGRNITDRVHVATTGVVADAGGQDSRQFLPGDGVSVFAGLEWRWGG